MTVICDDPRHARGKVAKIDTFVRVGDLWVARSTAKSSLTVMRRPDDPAMGVWGSGRRWRRAGSSTGHNQQRYKCKLCGMTLACTESTLQKALNIIAAEGESHRTLRNLCELVSTLA